MLETVALSGEGDITAWTHGYVPYSALLYSTLHSLCFLPIDDLQGFAIEISLSKIVAL